MFAAYKGYTLFDSYPRYGRLYRRQEEAKDGFEEKVKTIQDEVNQVSNVNLKDARLFCQKANKSAQKATALLDDAISRCANYQSTYEGIQEACDAALRTYRNANVEVRDNRRNPPPPHFSQKVALQRPHSTSTKKFNEIKAHIQTQDRKIKSDFEKLSQQIPTEVHRLLSEGALDGRLDRLKQIAEREVKTEKINQREKLQNVA